MSFFAGVQKAVRTSGWVGGPLGRLQWHLRWPCADTGVSKRGSYNFRQSFSAPLWAVDLRGPQNNAREEIKRREKGKG